MATGNSDKPAANSFKWFYGDIYGFFLNKKLIVDFYADYERLNWSPTWHHDRQMIKGFVAYNTQLFTIGVEGYINNLEAIPKLTLITGGADTIATKASGYHFLFMGTS